ncbi:DUF420 domain-containing protein [Calditrichota bacterium]
MTVADLPALNATLNLTSGVLLILGYRQIRRSNHPAHKKFMVAASIVSGLFLISYLIYHRAVGSVPYPHYDWTRTLYFIILVPHIILAALMVVPIVTGLTFAFKDKFRQHRALMRWVFPVWVFVSLSGLVVYLMLYQL